jgi:hypothetical protein
MEFAMTVLLVEDPTSHTMISDLLTRCGCRRQIFLQAKVSEGNESRLLERTGDSNGSDLLVSA